MHETGLTLFIFFYIVPKTGEEKKFLTKRKLDPAHLPLTLWSIKDRSILHLIK